MNIKDYYQEGRYKLNSKSVRDKQHAKRIIAILKTLKGYTFSKVLDIGCGDGGIGRLLKKEKNIDVYGVDISKKGVELANEGGVHAKVGDVSVKIPFDNKAFDLVVAAEILEHVANPDVFLREIYRVLKPGGIILITTPNLSSWLNRILFLVGLYPLFLEASTEVKVGYGRYKKFFSGQLVGHIHVFNLSALKEILQYYKFYIERISTNTVDFEAPKSKIITFAYRFIDKVMSHIPSLSSDIVILARK